MKRLSWVLQVLGAGSVLGAIADLSLHAAFIIGGVGALVVGYVIERDA